ncbi:hypothetical protein M405DRAFT_932024 [Rhizopogon salebrosus TDB-379]|nr:hypothetical protein M405DRAFT_932024 [Rhizopogon salebrosus TDB-379]
MSLNFIQPGLDAYRRPNLTHCCLYSDQIQQLGASTFPKARNQFSDLEHGDGLLEYPEDIFGTATLKASVETALADVERLGQKRAEKRAGLRIEEKESDGLPLGFVGESESPPHPHTSHTPLYHTSISCRKGYACTWACTSPAITATTASTTSTATRPDVITILDGRRPFRGKFPFVLADLLI